MINSGQHGKLGRDLPDTEEQLFDLEQFPILDIQSGIESMGSPNLFRQLLDLMNNTAIPDDTRLIKQAWANSDWDEVEQLAHRIKSGALYCGTVRMQYACQYLERYRKAGHTKSLDKLYHQLIQVLEETRQVVSLWMASETAVA